MLVKNRPLDEKLGRLVFILDNVDVDDDKFLFSLPMAGKGDLAEGSTN